MIEVKWIKIVTDIFDDEKVLLIESLPESDSIIVIWFKLLCLAGKQNNSGVFMLNNKIAYTDEMLSSIFRRPLNTLKLALKAFEQYGMIEIINNVITIPNWGKHQTLDTYEKRKERDRIYQKERRDKQKSLVSGEKSYDRRPTNDDKSLSVGALELDKELDIELDIDTTTITNYYEQNIGQLTSTVLSDLNYFVGDGFEQKLIIKCLELAVSCNARNKWSYARGILRKLLPQGIKTLSEFQTELKNSEKPQSKPFVYEYKGEENSL